MKFQRIGTIRLLARTAFFSFLLISGAPSALALDEDMPPPAEPDLSSSKPPAGAFPGDVQREDESIPAPSLGDDALPEPSVDRGQEKAKNQVNRPSQEDEIFLPTPNVNDNVYYAPVGTPAPRVTSEDVDWRYVQMNRPVFSFYGGFGGKSYPTSLVKDDRNYGPTVGASIRAINLAQTVFLHAYLDYGWYSPGDVGSVSNVSDQIFQYGGVFELGIGRRLSLLGTLLRRQSLVTSNTVGAVNVEGRRMSDLVDVGTQPTWNLGLGFQWDFYVEPHGSAGIRGHISKDLYSVLLSFAIEPKTKKKLSLNFDEIEQ